MWEKAFDGLAGIKTTACGHCHPTMTAVTAVCSNGLKMAAG